MTPRFVLHGYWRATAPYRVRIGLNLKGLAFHYAPVNLLGGAQKSDAYRALNAQGLVPALEADGQVLTQSLAFWLGSAETVTVAGWPTKSPPARQPPVSSRARSAFRPESMAASPAQPACHPNHALCSTRSKDFLAAVLFSKRVMRRQPHRGRRALVDEGIAVACAGVFPVALVEDVVGVEVEGASIDGRHVGAGQCRKPYRRHEQSAAQEREQAQQRARDFAAPAQVFRASDGAQNAVRGSAFGHLAGRISVMTDLLIATTSAGKLREIVPILQGTSPSLRLLTLDQLARASVDIGDLK